MVIETLPKDGAYFAPVKDAGTEITVGVDSNSVVIDAGKYQQTSQAVIDVWTKGAGQELTLDSDDAGNGIYNVATIAIPAQKTEIVENGTKMNEQTGKEETNYEMKVLPLDMEAVQVTLWPLPFEVSAPEKETTEEAESADTKEEEN